MMPDQPSADDLFGTGRTASLPEIRDAVAAELGLDVPARPRPPDHPDVSALAEQLGLR